MSAKTSPSSSRDANMGASSVVPASVQIKKELPSDEIKEFAHNTMNELLGWYGFEGVDVDRLDLTAKTSRLLQSAAAAAVANQQQQHHHQQQLQHEQQQHLERKRSSLFRSSRSALAAAYLNNNNSNSSSNKNNGAGGASSGAGTGAGAGAGGGVSGNGRKGGLQNCSSTTTTPSDHDTRSSREEDSKSPLSIGKTAGVPHTEEKIDFSNCCWCHRPIAENAPDYLTSSDGPRYCSESCFAQSRRASFKKAKTCDWCKHVRHAVSYVDFQDGASQLQFCSEKCLNQYKMQIFCQETQTHLDLHPHLRDQVLDPGSEAGLITPDLWLRNCRSRSASPASTLSVSPGPPPAAPFNRGPDSSPPPSHHASKPLISVAPVSKLLAQKSPVPAVAPPPPPPPLQRQLGSKLGRRKRQHRGLSSSSGSETVASLLQKQQQQQAQQQAPPTLTADFAGSSVPLPPISPMPNMQESPQQHQQQQAPPAVPPAQALPRGPTAIPASYFATPSNGVPMGGHPFVGRPPPPPHHFLPPPPHGMMPRGFAPHFGPPLPPQMPELSALLGAVPPVTVMVPYPIIIPLPIPIPVPLPIVDFYKAHLTPEQRKRFDEERATSTRRDGEANPGEPEQPQPLDCSSKAKSEQELELEKQKEEAPPEPQEDKPSDKEQNEEEKESIPKTNPDIDTTPASPSSVSPESSSSSLETHCIVRDSPLTDPEADSQKLPKLKITRLQTKRTLIQTKEAAAECSRPLRKRKRIIDCDFQKMAVKELEASEATETDAECNMTNNGNAKAKK